MLHLALVATLSSTLLATATSPVALRPVPTVARAPAPPYLAGTAEAACDDGTAGGTLVQQRDGYYGNHFAAPCASARMLTARFVHYGYGLAGPYAFRLHLFDAACREVGATAELETPGAPDDLATVAVDLSSLGWCVTGDFQLPLEPPTCADGAAGHDCFPAVVVDASADGEAAKHCATVNLVTGGGRECFAARSADGRYFDFGLRVDVLCEAPACTSAIETTSWSQVKHLYRDPSARSPD